MRRLRALIGQLAFDVSMAAINFALRVPSHPWRRLVLRSAGVQLGRKVTIARRVRLTIRGRVEIGDRSIVNEDVVLDGRGGLTIGSDVNISPGVEIYTAEHDPRSPEFAGRNRGVVLGARSWLATRAIVLPGTTVGEGVVVSAGAVVHGNVDPWTIVAGNPAAPIGTRPREAQERLTPYRRFFH